MLSPLAVIADVEVRAAQHHGLVDMYELQRTRIFELAKRNTSYASSGHDGPKHAVGVRTCGGQKAKKRTDSVSNQGP